MVLISQKEYDIYGNLILDIFIEKSNMKFDSEEYREYIEYGAVHPKKVIGDTVLYTFGHSASNEYDSKNMLIKEEWFSFSSAVKLIRRFKYIYSDTGLLIKKIKSRQEVYLQDMRRVRGERKTAQKHIIFNSEADRKIDENRLHVNYFEYRYDCHDNLSEEIRADFYVPLETDIETVTIPDGKTSLTDIYENIYNSSGQLIQVYYQRHHSDEKKLLYNFIYDDTGKIEWKEEYRSGKVYKIKHIYRDGELYEEEEYSSFDRLLKITRYETIEGRICKRIISPVRDEFRWYLRTFDDDSSIDVVIEEEMVTKEIMSAIFEYVVKNIIDPRLPPDIFFDSEQRDVETCRDELDQLRGYYYQNYNISFWYSDRC